MYFQFQRNIFQQIFDIPMDSPLSSVLADIFIEFFAAVALEYSFYKLKRWFRYVGVTFIVWPSARNRLITSQNIIIIRPLWKLSQTKSFFSSTCQSQSARSFTLCNQIKKFQWIENSMIHILDVTISNIQNKHEFAIFRKSFRTKITINSS